MDTIPYTGTESMGIFALANKDQAIARIDRSCVINGRAFAVEPGGGVEARQYVALSVGQLRWINHFHNGLLFLVATTEDEATRYTPVLRLDVDTLPTVIAD